MTESITLLLGLSLPVLLIGLIWIIVRYYKPRLSQIDDKLLEVTVTLKQSAQQLRKIGTMLEEDSKTELTMADLVNSSQVTTDSLKKLLWQMRFDEDSYVESTAATATGTVQPDNAGVNSSNKPKRKNHEALDDSPPINATLKNSNDRLDTIFEYMTKSGNTL